MDPFLLAVLSFLTLLAIAAAVKGIASKSGIPFTVLLLLTGMGITLLQKLTGMNAFPAVHFSSEILFYIFLPTLIFESAYHLKLQSLRSVFREVVVLSTLALALSVGVTAIGVHYLLDLSWNISILFGVIIAPTDPAAVLAIFKQIRVPQKLKTLIEGESLVNDGTALILFQAVKGLALGGAYTLSSEALVQGFGGYAISVGGATVLGLTMGIVFLFAMSMTNSRPVQLGLSFILAHATFLVADGIFHISGVIATMVAGIVLGNLGPRKMSKTALFVFQEMWEFLGFLSNSLVFLLLGGVLGSINLLQYWAQIAVASGIVLGVARPISVLTAFLCTNLTRAPYQKVSLKEQTILMWGGLRGALSAAMVLILPQNFPEYEVLLAVTGGVILVTFALNATTLKSMLQTLKMNALSFAEKIQRLEAEILIDQRVRGYLRQLKHKGYVTKESFGMIDANYKNTQDVAAQQLIRMQEKISIEGERVIEKILIYHALMLERNVYEQMYRNHELSEARLQALTNSLDRQVERLDQDELPHERRSKPKIAPKIPNVNPYKESTLWGIPNKWWSKKKQKIIRERLQHYRARQRAGEQVVRDLKSLSTSACLTCEKQIIESIRERYRGWIANAEAKAELLRIEHGQMVDTIERRLVEYMCLKKELSLEQQYHANGFLSDKVSAQYEAKLGRQLELSQRGLR